MAKKIYVAYTGGTIGMKPTASGYAPGDNLMALLKEKLPQDVMNNLPQFELYEYKKLIDSSNIRPDNWKQIAEDIASRYNEFDGFVILHGTRYHVLLMFHDVLYAAKPAEAGYFHRLTDPPV